MQVRTHKHRIHLEDHRTWAGAGLWSLGWRRRSAQGGKWRKAKGAGRKLDLEAAGPGTALGFQLYWPRINKPLLWWSLGLSVSDYLCKGSWDFSVHRHLAYLFSRKRNDTPGGETIAGSTGSPQIPRHPLSPLLSQPVLCSPQSRLFQGPGFPRKPCGLSPQPFVWRLAPQGGARSQGSRTCLSQTLLKVTSPGFTENAQCSAEQNVGQ